MAEEINLGGIAVAVRLRAEALDQGVQDAKTKLNGLGEAGEKAVKKANAELEAATRRLELQGNQIEILKAKYKALQNQIAKKGNKATNDDQLALSKLGMELVNAQAKQQAYAAAVKEAKQAQEEQAAASQSGMVSLVGWGAVLSGLVSTIGSAITAYQTMRSAQVGLQTTAKSTGESMSELEKIQKELTQDGLMTDADAAQSIKNLLLYGYSADQAREMLIRLKDSAAYNRQAHYSLSEAVRVTTEGVRMENSVLSDAAGVQKNIAKMYEDYAASVGKSTANLTQQEKAQAVLNGVIAETDGVLGNAARYADEYGGAVAGAGRQITLMSASLGEGMTNGLKPFVELLGAILTPVAEFVDANKAMSAGLATTAVVFAALNPIIKMAAKIAEHHKKKKLEEARALAESAAGSAADATAKTAEANATAGATAAQHGLNAAMSVNPVLAVVSAVSLLVGGIIAFASAAEEAKKKQEELTQAKKDFEQKVQNAAGKEGAEELDGYAKQIEKLIKLKEQEAELEKHAAEEVYGFLASEKQLEHVGSDLVEVRNRMKEIAEEAGEFGELWLSQPVEELNNTLTETQKRARDLWNSEELQQFSADVSSAVKALDSLASAYDKASDGQALSANQLLELIYQYPEVARYVAETGDATLNYGRVVEQVYEAKRKAMIADLEENKIAVESNIRLYLDEITALRSLGVAGVFASEAFQTATDNLTEHRAALDQIEARLAALGKDIGIGDWGGSSDSSAANALSEAYDKLKHQRSMELITEKEYYNRLEALRNQHTTKDSAEWRKYTEELYSLQKSMADKAVQARKDALTKERSAVDYLHDKDEMSENEYLRRLEKLRDQYLELDYETWQKYDLEIYNLRKELREKETQEIQESLTDAFDRQVSDLDSYVSKLQSLNGMEIGGKLFLFDERDAIAQYEALIAENKQYIAQLKKNHSSLTDAEKDALERREEANRQLYATVEQLQIEAFVRWQNARKEQLKQQYNDAIKEAEAESDARVKAMEAEIAAIDQLMKDEEKADEQAAHDREIRQLEESILFERDEENRRALEKELAAKQAEWEKQQRKEALEQQKEDLQTQIDAEKDALAEKISRIEELRDKETEALSEVAQIEKLMQDDRLKNLIQFNDARLDAISRALKEEENLYSKGTLETVYSKINGWLASFAPQNNLSVQTAASAAERVIRNSANTIVVNQTNEFNVPVQSPAAIAKETALASQRLALTLQ